MKRSRARRVSPSARMRWRPINASTRATSDAVNRSEPGPREEGDAPGLGLAVGHREEPHRRRRPTAERRGQVVRPLHQRRAAGQREASGRHLTRLVDWRHPHLRGVTGGGQDPPDGSRVTRRGQVAGPAEGVQHRLRSGRGRRAGQQRAGAGGVERGREHPAVELGEDLDHQLVDGLMSIELVDVDRHHVAVERGDDRRDLGERAGQVGQLHSESVSAHSCTVPDPRFGVVATAGTRGEPR